MKVFNEFDNGTLYLPKTDAISAKKVDIGAVEWSKHAVSEGVELKHFLTAKDTGGAFSYHLVRVAPGKKILMHIHETQLETHEVVAGDGTCEIDGELLPYKVGMVAVIPAGTKHEVTAGENGIYMFAKFMPALV